MDNLNRRSFLRKGIAGAAAQQWHQQFCQLQLSDRKTKLLIVHLAGLASEFQ